VPAFKVLIVAMKAQQGWKKIPPEHRRAIVQAARRSARKHGPAVARTVRKQGPTVAKQLAKVLRESRKKP
jgi:acyl-CoA reductase-like NAD-dependent aldehyde dehydrogenase